MIEASMITRKEENAIVSRIKYVFTNCFYFLNLIQNLDDIFSFVLKLSNHSIHTLFSSKVFQSSCSRVGRENGQRMVAGTCCIVRR